MQPAQCGDDKMKYGACGMPSRNEYEHKLETGILVVACDYQAISEPYTIESVGQRMKVNGTKMRIVDRYPNNT